MGAIFEDYVGFIDGVRYEGDKNIIGVSVFKSQANAIKAMELLRNYVALIIIEGEKHQLISGKWWFTQNPANAVFLNQWNTIIEVAYYYPAYDEIPNILNEVQEYAIQRFFFSSMPFDLRVPKRDNPTIAGDISFSGGRRFIRNNIFIEIRTVGDMNDKISALTKDIDELLLTRPTASSADPFKPIITRFGIANSLVEYNSQTKLIIDVVDPQGSELYFFWRLTGGGTIKDEFGNWYYYAAADPGTDQTITLIVINDRGYYCSSSVKVKIKSSWMDIFDHLIQFDG